MKLIRSKHRAATLAGVIDVEVLVVLLVGFNHMNFCQGFFIAAHIIHEGHLMLLFAPIRRLQFYWFSISGLLG